MTHEQARTINKKRGNIFPIWWIEQFAEEWDRIVADIKTSHIDLSEIPITEGRNETD